MSATTNTIQTTTTTTASTTTTITFTAVINKLQIPLLLLLPPLLLLPLLRHIDYYLQSHHFVRLLLLPREIKKNIKNECVPYWRKRQSPQRVYVYLIKALEDRHSTLKHRDNYFYVCSIYVCIQISSKYVITYHDPCSP